MPILLNFFFFFRLWNSNLFLSVVIIEFKSPPSNRTKQEQKERGRERERERERKIERGRERERER